MYTKACKYKNNKHGRQDAIAKRRRKKSPEKKILSQTRHYGIKLCTFTVLDFEEIAHQI